jgi:hypothetical protein
MTTAQDEQQTEPNYGLLPGRITAAKARVMAHHQHKRGDGWQALGWEYHYGRGTDHAAEAMRLLRGLPSLNGEDLRTHITHLALRIDMMAEDVLERIEREGTHAADTAPCEEEPQ